MHATGQVGISAELRHNNMLAHSTVTNDDHVSRSHLDLRKLTSHFRLINTISTYRVSAVSSIVIEQQRLLWSDI